MQQTWDKYLSEAKYKTIPELVGSDDIELFVIRLSSILTAS